MRVVALTIALLALAAAPAGAATVRMRATGIVAQPYQGWLDASLAIPMRETSDEIQQHGHQCGAPCQEPVRHSDASLSPVHRRG